MQERKPGCICELDTESGEPVVDNYAECPVHKPDAITPKDTAQVLFDKFDGIECEPDDHYYDQRATCKHQAKKSADICVDEILSVLDAFQTHAYAKVLIPYYKEVKQEIQNL
jgi:hypothetical protein